VNHVEAVGGIVVETNFSTLKSLFTGIDSGLIITLPPWLQRKLQQEEWRNKKSKKAKSYFSSAVKGTLRFEPFALVPINLLIRELEKVSLYLDEEQVEEKDEIVKSIKYIKNHVNAKFVIIDGQSRGYLSIIPFFTNKIPFNMSHTLRKIDSTNGNIIEEYDLKNRYFKDMPDWVQEYLFKLTIIQNTITSGDLSEIVKALISKQMGVSWSDFQMIYAEYAYSNLFTRLRKVIKKPIEDFFERKLKDIPKKYKADVNGLEFSITNWMLYLRDKSFPGIDKIVRTCEYKDTTPTKASFERYVGYLNEFRKSYTNVKGTNKVKLKLWFTYGILRDLLENGGSSDGYYKSFGLNDSFNIIRVNQFLDWFLKTDKKLFSKVSKDSKPHWEKTKMTNGKSKFVKVEGGYPASYGADNDDTIKDRLFWLVDEFKKEKQEFIDDGTISVTTPKPSSGDVMTHNNFKDADGNDVNLRLPYHNGHKSPESKTGDNSLDNFVPQDPTDNQEYSDTELILK
jgi:hypothetical protein